MEDKNESKVGKKLNDKTTRRVIIMVLAMLFTVPIFTVGTYIGEPNSYDYGLALVHHLGPDTPGGKAVFENTVEIQSQLEESPLIRLYVTPNETKKETVLEWLNEEVSIKDLRSMEKEIVTLETNEPDEIYLAIYDLRHTVVLQAQLGIATTFLVCMVLASGALIFSKMTTDLVISPIEQMIEKVNNITKDPLKAAHDEEERLLFEEMAEADQQNQQMATMNSN